MDESVPVGPVLADVGRVNMMFCLEWAAPGPGRRRLGAVGGQQEGFTPVSAAAEAERTRAQLAALCGTGAEEIEWRVAASLFHQGLANRVLSPVLGAALVHRVRLDARLMHWDPSRAGGSIALATDQERAAPLPAGPSGAADWVATTVLDPADGVLGRAESALVRAGSVSPRLLRGNLASALAGAVRSLGSQRTARSRQGERLVRDLLARPALDLSGSYAGTGPGGRARFARTTCCLYYRLPGGGTCGDCALG